MKYEAIPIALFSFLAPALAPAVAPSRASADVRWVGDYETGDVSQYSGTLNETG